MKDKKFIPLVTGLFLLLQYFSPLLALIPVKAQENPNAPICSSETNLVANGGFEVPVVAHEKNWNIYPNGTGGMGWTVEWFGGSTTYESTDRPEVPNLELHRGVQGWLPQEGQQYAELDSDWDGPSGSLVGEPASVKISQSIPTNPGYKYEVSYYFSARPGETTAENVLKSEWNGVEMDTHTAAGGANTAWTKHTFTVEATDSSTVLSFTDLGTANSEGTFLDDVVVKCKGPVVEDKITICHATPPATAANGYNQITIDLNGLNGHKNHAKDIVPPNSGNIIPEGKNWDEAGQAIWRNQCEVPTNTPPVEPSPTPTRGYTPEPDLSTVQVCKVDTAQNPLPGWKVMLLGDKVESVAVYPDDTVDSKTPTTSSNLPEDDYVLLANGSYKYRGGTDLESDPGYSERLVSDGLTGPYAPWINIMDLGIVGALGVTVNDTPADWGYFSPSHEYARGFTNYSGQFSFTSIDDKTSDNVGNMNVDIYKGYAGVTERNGCVTFEDVPYGSYTTDEILMQNWNNQSGKGAAVEVNQDEHTFYLVNYENPEPSTLTAYKVVCTEEQYLPNNTQGVIGPNTAQQWVDQSEGECYLAEDWDFQYAPVGTGTFGDFQTDTSELESPWTTFNVGTPVELTGGVEVREVFPSDDYVPFSNAGNVSAELWCTGDQANYDNWEWIQNPQEDTDYYCVAFNALDSGKGSVEGYKFNDLDGDGVRDDGEPTIEGWGITLWQGDVEVDTTVTNENGYYEFDELPVGQYKVTEESRNGWKQTTPLDPAHCVVTVEKDSTEECEFGNFKYGKISGYKFEDIDGDGVWDDGEPGVKNWRIRLYKDGQQVKSVLTNNSGAYNFGQLEAGAYEVREDSKSGWAQSAPQTEVCNINVISGTDETCNFGNYKESLINGFKFEDRNGDGDYDFGEPGLKNWEITLKKGDEVVATTETNILGYYYFYNLAPGSYTVSEEDRDGWYQTYPGGDEVCEFTLESGDVEFCSFGNFEYGRIDGYKYEDMNGNGKWDEGEDGLRFWPIKLYKNGNYVKTDLTDSEGYYEFTDLKAGEYEVKEADVLGWEQTAPKRGTCTFDIRSGSEKRCVFGNFKYSSIIGMKYEDQNINGSKELLEKPLKGWEISLWKDNGNGTFNTEEDTLIDTDTTNLLGLYGFYHLVPGTYFLTEEVKDGWYQTDPGEPGYLTFEIESGNFITGRQAYFGNYEGGTIIGRKYNDVNVNGSFDQDEKNAEGNPFRLDNWNIRLYNDEWALVDQMDTGDDSTEAGNVGKGQFKFVNLQAGTYYVCEESGDETWWQTEPAAPNGVENSSGAEDEAGRCYKVVINKSDQEVDNRQFGNTQGGSINGLKWNDDNGNGIKDIGEPTMSEWTIELYNEGEEEGDQPGTFVKSTVTDENGEYSFDGLVPGTYYVMEVNQSPWVKTFPLTDYHMVVVTGWSDENSYDFGNNVTPDLVVTKDDGQTTASPGETLVYDVTVKNVGTESATNVTIVDTLPSNVDFLGSTPSGAYNGTLRTITWVVPSLDPEEEWTATVTVEVHDDVEDGDEVVNTIRADEAANLGQPLELELSETMTDEVINYSEPDPTIWNNVAVDTNIVALGRVGGVDTVRDQGRVLGTSDTLADTGMNMYVPVAVGLALISILALLNLSTMEPRILKSLKKNK